MQHPYKHLQQHACLLCLLFICNATELKSNSLTQTNFKAVLWFVILEGNYQ